MPNMAGTVVCGSDVKWYRTAVELEKMHATNFIKIRV